MQIFSVLGYAIPRKETLVIPELLGEQPELEVGQFGGQSVVFPIAKEQPMTSQEFLEAIIKKLSEHFKIKIIFLDIIEATNTENNIIFFDNTFKNLKFKNNDCFVRGSLGDIISLAGVNSYYIAEEEDGTILSIIRKT